MKKDTVIVIEIYSEGLSLINIKTVESDLKHYYNKRVTFNFDNQTVDNDCINNFVAVVRFLKKHITDQEGKDSYIIWILEDPFIKTHIMFDTRQLPLSNSTQSICSYSCEDKTYYDQINQALLLQIRIITYALESYCMSPVSYFFLFKDFINDDCTKKLSDQTVLNSSVYIKTVLNYQKMYYHPPEKKSLDRENYFLDILIRSVLNVCKK